MDSLDTAATTDSAPVTTEPATDPSAGTQNTAPGQATPQPEVPFHQHPRWQQVMAERKQDREMIRGLSQQLQELQAASRPQGGLSHDQRAEYMKAGDAIKTVLGEHPELKVLLDLAKRAPHLMQASDGVQRLNQAQVQSITRQSRAAIASLAKAENLPTDPEFLEYTEDLIAARIDRMPDGRARFLGGDTAVVNEAFDAIKGKFLAHLRRDASATVVDTKKKVVQLPPRPAGGSLSRDADPKLDPNDSKSFWSGLRNASRRVTQAGS